MERLAHLGRAVGLALLAASVIGVTPAGAGDDGAKPPNVILISIDTLRADHLSCYGYERPTSPAIDALARQGTLFANAQSASSWTTPSHMTMMTGLLSGAHRRPGAHGRARPQDLPVVFNVRTDPGERHARAASPAKARVFQEYVERAIDDPARAGPGSDRALDEGTIAELRSLGYLVDE
jgi:hypothetical protein